jgi:hypothetical protein
VTITYTIDADPTELTAEGIIKRNFEGNTIYNVGLKLTPLTGSMEIDLIQSAFTLWTIVGESDKEVYNW